METNSFVFNIGTKNPTALAVGVCQYGLTVDEGMEILNASGLIVGDRINYLDVLGLTLDEIENKNDADILVIVDEAHRKAYNGSLQAGGLPRADGRTQSQWRTLLNQARNTLTHPHKRCHYLEKYVRQEIVSARTVESNPKTEPEIRKTQLTSPKPPQTTIRTTLSNFSSTQKVQPPENTPQSTVFIPGGEFLMGNDNENSDSDEDLLHSVYVDSFFMDRCPVTNGQFKMFVEANPQWRRPPDLYFWNIKWNASKKKT